MILADIVVGLMTLFVAALTFTLVLHLFLLKIPFVPTPRRIAEQMAQLAELHGGETVVDLGAGDGILLIAAKRLCSSITAVGYEIAPTVWLWGKFRIWLSGEVVGLRLQSMFRADLRDADVVFLYLFPASMKRLEEKFDTELKPGTRVISHAFRFPNRTPVQEVRLPWGRKEKKVFVYQW